MTRSVVINGETKSPWTVLCVRTFLAGRFFGLIRLGVIPNGSDVEELSIGYDVIAAITHIFIFVATSDIHSLCSPGVGGFLSEGLSFRPSMDSSF